MQAAFSTSISLSQRARTLAYIKLLICFTLEAQKVSNLVQKRKNNLPKLRAELHAELRTGALSICAYV